MGLLFGTACLLGFLYVWRRPGRGRGCRGRGAGRRGMLSMLSRRLDATPAQEKVMRDAFEELSTSADGVWKNLRETRSELAAAFRTEELDPEFIVVELGRVDDALSELRRTLAGRIAELHTILDPDQRAKLAEMLDSKFRRPWWGPYRTAY